MKHKTFEEIIREDFRWPAAGDTPFVEAADPMDNANIGGSGTTRLVIMMEGYRKAADIMVDHASVHRADRDFLVCPIIFNYRQFLELSLKYMLVAFGRHVGIKPNWNSHDLIVLWKDVATMLDLYGTTDPDEADPVVAEVIGQFAKIDPGSYSHRYPVDRKGQVLPLAMTDLHLPTLKGVMKAVSNYFTGCDGYLDHLVSSQP